MSVKTPAERSYPGEQGAAYEAEPKTCAPQGTRRNVVTVKTLLGKPLSISIETQQTVGALMEAIEEREGIPPNGQRLLFAGQVLQPQRTLAEYNILNESHVVQMILAFKDCSRA